MERERSEDAKHGSPIGYCIYRGVQNDDKTLVRLNSLSFPGTSCTDDMVQTGQNILLQSEGH